LRTTKPIDGGLSADEYITRETGKATFKVKQSAVVEQPASTEKMLTNEELQQICLKSGLTRGEVYQVRT
jgi:hypothetical protein